MARVFDGDKLVIATHNPGKLREIGELVAPFGVAVASAADLGLDEPVEDGDTFKANALIKAHAAAQASGVPALADDSGLAVEALGGAPGIHSARWAGPDKNFKEAMERIWDLILESEDRRAHFVCALALAWPDGHSEVFEGRVDGTLIWPPTGDKGFGYDPMFQPAGYFDTFGEMDPKEKHAMSHRAEAFKQLVTACFQGRRA
ncbi:MAG: non-canonical purine NTP pyrophosphatase, RdgB/HAM1 family [Rhodospirillaceae bacterium]|nr:non-canonical purine NTP pyrophosphatase, RdgB/HAM1 family [Rhodospirillaceae bacterium]|tara:strand:+ start:70 stop:678 length:609 start_codon:yes stop_codon:yes gene_type:complete